MIRLVIDGKAVTDMDALQDFFARELDLPEWYGRNLDALYDCLTDPGPEVEIVLENQETLLENLGLGYWRLVRMLADAAEESRRIHFLV